MIVGEQLLAHILSRTYIEIHTAVDMKAAVLTRLDWADRAGEHEKRTLVAYPGIAQSNVWYNPEWRDED